LDCCDGGRANARRKTGASLAGVVLADRGGLMLGMPLARREAMTEALLAGGLTSDVRDAFLCNVVVVVVPMAAREGFLRSGSGEAGARSCE